MTDSEQSTTVPPGSFGLPFIGETLQFIRDDNFLQNRINKHGKIFKTHILGRKTVIVTGGDAARFVLSTGMKHFSWREGWPDTFKTLLGESLFLMDGEEHRMKRKLLMPAFHREALHRYFDTMQSLTLNYLAKWEQQGEFAWFETNKQLTFDIANVLLLGADADENNEAISQAFADLTGGLLTFGVNI
ncbi:MAG: cytochrome P450, partial [Aggregatilineales bacterium]